ncbi:MAG: AAA family ATPase [Pseudomonadota bacterium]
MIFVGNQRGHGRDLALHLMNGRENEHVMLHDIRGFVADDLMGAFLESEAIALGTKCTKYLFSLSLSPPPGEVVPIHVFEAVIDRIEQELGLVGQPRAIVFHEKKARRHAHCVWSRINPNEMKAVNLPHFKNKLQSIARELYREHGWQMPPGFVDQEKRDPLRFDQVEAAQAKTAQRDSKALKAFFAECWLQSDSLGAFRAALLSEGFVLAKGSRRSFVAVNEQGTVYSLSRWTSVGAKALRQRLGTGDGLPSVEQAKQSFLPSELPLGLGMDASLEKLVARHKTEQEELEVAQAAERTSARSKRQGQLPQGLKAAWAKLTGKYEKQVQVLADAARAERQRHRLAFDTLIARQLGERRDYERAKEHQRALDALVPQNEPSQPDKRQRLVLRQDDPLPTAAALELNPDLLAQHLSDKEETITQSDIKRALNKIERDPDWITDMTKRILASRELAPCSSDQEPRYTTRSFLAAQEQLRNVADTLEHDQSFFTSADNLTEAIRLKNRGLAQIGGSLSEEQRVALEHLSSAEGLSCVVGIAGSGKSTLLEVARLAWEKQGYTVQGAALAGKAADGLQRASGIKSRTLAAFEKSWEHGFEPIAPDCVVVIDEVGMVGTRQLSRVVSKLAELRCKVVLVGDPEQLQPIQAGTPFKDMLAVHKHARLEEVRRQKSDWQREASKAFAMGNTQQALDAYEARNHVVQSQSPSKAISALVADYLADIETSPENKTRLALAPRRKDVFAINQHIRAKLVAQGELTDEVMADTEHGPRAFANGDRILFTRNDRALEVTNGLLGQVIQSGKGILKVRLDENARTVSIDLEEYNSLDHGYAVSIHRSQGCTVDQAFVLDSKSMDRHLTYVAMTRHREQGRIYRSATKSRETERTARKQYTRIDTYPRLVR